MSEVMNGDFITIKMKIQTCIKVRDLCCLKHVKAAV